MKATLLFASVILCAVSAHAADVKGQTFNTVEEQPEPYATIRIFALTDTVKPVTYGTTNESGYFKLHAAPGKYRLKAQAVGQKTLQRDFELTSGGIDFGRLDFQPDNLLSEVTVQAAKPLVTREIDRISYDVTEDADAQTSSVSEILSKVPMVNVDGEGNITVRGSSSFKIYKNGRPNKSFSTNAKELFKAIPASTIKKIEVITDPGAREDAEGTSAILNIVTTDNTTIHGAMLNVNLHASSQANFVPTPFLWGSAQLGKFVASAYGGYWHSNRENSRSHSESVTDYVQTGNRFESRNINSGTNDGGYAGIDMSFELDSLNLFTAEFSYNQYGMKADTESFNKMFGSDGSELYSYHTTGFSHVSPSIWLEGAFNYQHSTRRKGELITLSYQISGNTSKTNNQTNYVDAVNMPVDYTQTNLLSRTRQIEQTAQADWTRPFGEKHVLDVGAKYIHRYNRAKSHQDYVGGEGIIDDNFSHLTQVAALFADYRIKFGRFGARAGLRYEYSRLSAKFNDPDKTDFSSNLNDFVPNASFSWSPNDKNTFKASYGMSISRPGIDYLNPTVVSSPLSVSYGNPNLESARNNSLNLNYSFMSAKFFLDASVNYSFINNDMAEVTTVDNDFITNTYDNGMHTRNWSVSFYGSWNPTAKTSFGLNGSFGQDHLSLRTTDYKSLTRWNYNVMLRYTQHLPWKLRLSVFGAIFTQGASSLYSYMTFPNLSNFYYAANISRSFLKEDRLTVTLGVHNPGRMHGTYEQHTVNMDALSVGRSTSYRQTAFMVNVVWRFGSMSAQVKTIDKIVNDDVRGAKSAPSQSQQ